MKKHRYNPSKIAERHGCSNFSVDEEEDVVYVKDLHKLAKSFGVKIAEDAYAFKKFGWLWKGVST